jgi:hypothetical protein
MTSLGPVEGLRIAFDRVAVDGEGAAYVVSIGEGPSLCRAEARLGLGRTELGTFDRPPPPWAVDTALGLLKTLTKNHAESADWPRRIHRWRAPARRQR